MFVNKPIIKLDYHLAESKNWEKFEKILSGLEGNLKIFKAL